MAALFGADDRLVKRAAKLVDWSNPFRTFGGRSERSPPAARARRRDDRERRQC
jgi:hypothetical protein